jgi:protein-L-isoaspartate(D-aspartate) O-methyltransferase
MFIKQDMMTNFSDFDSIATTISKIDRTFYTLYEDGSQVHQTSALGIITRMIRMLAPCPNDCILEIGTGSGYSTALLSNIVGEFGTVTSVDIDTDMVKRASQLLRQNGRSNVRVLVGDGRIGQPDYAPYNRIIVWASAENEVPIPLVE